MYKWSGHRSSRIMHAINKKRIIDLPITSAGTFFTITLLYFFPCSCTSVWSDNCYYPFPCNPASLLNQKRSTNNIPVNEFTEGVSFWVTFVFQVWQQISHLWWVWSRVHINPLQTALSKLPEVFCSHTPKRCLYGNIFLSPTVLYTILKAVQSVCERDRHNEESQFTWSNAKICQCD